MNFSQISHRGSLALAASLICGNFSGAGALAADPSGAATADEIEQLPPLTVTGQSPVPDQYQLPQVIQTITAGEMDDTVNAVDVEDAVKYLSGLFVRKRNYGDNQAVLATRTWGVNSSARSLVYVDGVLLSALIANNNTIGAPRWGMVSPIEIASISVMDGPFAAAYPGNSMGAVVEITTRMPDRLEESLTQTEALQPFSLYSTKNTYLTDQTAAVVGDRLGKWSFWVSANEMHTDSQPLTFITAGSLPAGTTGGIIAWNKLGQPANILGASDIQVSNLVNANVTTAYDFSPTLRATYMLGVWDNDTQSAAQTYLRDASGQPTFGGVSSFAGGYYDWVEEQTMQSLALKSTGQGDWNWQIIGTLYDFDKDTQNIASAVAGAGTGLATPGKASLLGGTGWSTLDLKAAWDPQGPDGGQELSFGAHADEYQLVNPTYNTANWQTGDPFTSLSTEGNGDTETKALWIQDAWQFSPGLKAILGGRYEDWRAFDGVNVNGGTIVIQPDESASHFSPKGTLAWTAASDWTLTASAGEAYRFPTAGELYQLVSTGSIYTSPDPDLQPEQDWSGEVRAERKLADGSFRLSLFQEVVNNALVSQYDTLAAGSSTDYQYVMNVGKIRNRGVEAAVDRNDVLISGLELSGSVTYVDSRVLEDSGRGQFSAAVGKKAPYVPMWRATFVATYRPRRNLALTVAGRYSGQQYSTVDNTDVNPNAFGGFDEFFVLDAHVNWAINRHWALSGGCDNLLNRKYFLYHPFPQRTLVAEVKYRF